MFNSQTNSNITHNKQRERSRQETNCHFSKQINFTYGSDKL